MHLSIPLGPPILAMSPDSQDRAFIYDGCAQGSTGCITQSFIRKDKLATCKLLCMTGRRCPSSRRTLLGGWWPTRPSCCVGRRMRCGGPAAPLMNWPTSCASQTAQASSRSASPPHLIAVVHAATWAAVCKRASSHAFVPAHLHCRRSQAGRQQVDLAA